MLGVIVPLVYTFAITYKIVNINSINFIVCKLYLIKAVKCVSEEFLSSLFYSLGSYPKWLEKVKRKSKFKLFDSRI